MPPQPPHHQPGPHAARWLINYEGDVTPEQAILLLRRIADSIESKAAIELGELVVPLPPAVESVVRHEIAPRGEKVVKVEFKWADQGSGPADAAPVAALLT
jgi:hypothetical protein